MKSLKDFSQGKKVSFWLGIFLTLFSVSLCTWIHPFQENITGLGWIQGQLMLMALWAVWGCGLNAWLSWNFFRREGQVQKAKRMVLIWVGLILGCLIPYHEGPIAFLGDLHSLVCVICIIWWSWEWLYEGMVYPFSSLAKTTSLNLFLWFGLALLMCGQAGGICWAGEAIFVCGQAWSLWRAIY